MTEREKIDTALVYLKEQRIAHGTAAPLLWRLCWRAGVLIPPPHFLGFLSILVLAGLPFGIGLNVLVTGFLLVVGKPLAWPLAATGITGALLFGSMLGCYYRWSARRLGLPAWSEFRQDFDAPEDYW